MKAFLLKLVGRHPDQVRERSRFEENLRRMDERDKELEGLLTEIRKADKAIQDSADIRLASQYPPPSEEEDDDQTEQPL